MQFTEVGMWPNPRPLLPPWSEFCPLLSVLPSLPFSRLSLKVASGAHILVIVSSTTACRPVALIYNTIATITPEMLPFILFFPAGIHCKRRLPKRLRFHQKIIYFLVIRKL
jgi:hypothetical protein